MTQWKIWFSTAVIAILATVPLLPTIAQGAAKQEEGSYHMTSSEEIGLEIAMGENSLIDASRNEKDAIIVALNKCLRAPNGSSTEDEVGCLIGAYKSYDKILNEVYQLALKANNKETREAIQTAQRKWLAFRNADSSAIDSYERAEHPGTVMRVVKCYRNLAAIRARIAELITYLGTDQG